MFSTKGQGSLEYLLILGGAILVAVIVITAITSTPNPGNVAINSLSATCITSPSQALCESVARPNGVSTTIAACTLPFESTGSTPCCWDAIPGTGLTKCQMNPSVRAA